jgi:hypothetical protein
MGPAAILTCLIQADVYLDGADKVFSLPHHKKQKQAVLNFDASSAAALTR